MLQVLADRVSMYMHAYTLYSFVRPFGCSVLLASYDETDGAELYSIEPSGVCSVCQTLILLSSFTLYLSIFPACAKLKSFLALDAGVEFM